MFDPSMDRATLVHSIVGLVAMLTAAVARGLRDDTSWMPNLGRPARAVFVLAMGVLAGALEAAESAPSGEGVAVTVALAGMIVTSAQPLWMMVSEAAKERAARGRPPVPPAALLAVLCWVGGCGGSFEEARLAAHPAPRVLDAAPEARARCDELAREQVLWTSIGEGAAVGGATMAGGTIPARSDNAKLAMALGAAALGAGAATGTAVAHGFGRLWAAQCAGHD